MRHPEAVRSDERIEILDVLRGLAIFGILTVNMLGFHSPTGLPHGFRHGAADRVAEALISFFALGKFLSLFSFLFGLGFAVQFLRAETRAAPFLRIYARRLSVLFLVGIAHASLLWWGDILHVYALLGFLLLFFRTADTRTLILWAVVCLSVPIQLVWLETLTARLGTADTTAVRNIRLEAVKRDKAVRVEIEESMRIYGQGTFADISRQRLRDWRANIERTVPTAPQIFAMFLLGLYAGKREIFSRIDDHLPRIRKSMWWTGTIGAAGSFVFVLSRETSPSDAPTVTNAVGNSVHVVASTALCFFYVAGAILLFRKERFRKVLNPLACVGRTALSNYPKPAQCSDQNRHRLACRSDGLVGGEARSAE